VKFENGKPVSSKGILIDITDSKKNNYELKKAKEEAESALKVKSEFLARMSHEIRTPLNGVIGMTGLMLQSPLTIEQKDYLETIKNSGESLLLIINDILDFSRIEAGKMYVVKKSVDINNCIENIFELFSSKFTEKNLRFSYFKDNSIPQYLICDSEKIKQIISNLLSNALKFTQQGSVELSVSKVNIENNKLTLMFAVEDTGIGIDEKSVKLLFQPFSQLDSSNTRRYGGTGLGLTICKHLVELMEGKIWVESVPGKGSKFSFKINVEIDDKELINEKNNHPKDSVNNAALANIMPLRILLVEDNLINQKVTLKILRKFGYTADIAVNGIEAIEAVKNQDYDIIFMDIQMPEMDGYEATKNILGMYPHENQPIIIAITAAVMQGDRENCFAAGMVDYLPKPVLPDDIFGVLKKWGEKKIKID
jgi:CheY-like chemotaxis protein/nitrogen-specific signal transduction histidine kinase